MATRTDTLGPILDAIPGATARAMFGEYAIYLDAKVVGIICDDSLLLKDQPVARTLLPGAECGPAYPGSKDYIIADPWLDDPETLAAAARAIADALPTPKPKKPKAPK